MSWRVVIRHIDPASAGFFFGCQLPVCGYSEPFSPEYEGLFLGGSDQISRRGKWRVMGESGQSECDQQVRDMVAAVS